jgi:hypothetical protein
MREMDDSSPIYAYLPDDHEGLGEVKGKGKAKRGRAQNRWKYQVVR